MEMRSPTLAGCSNVAALPHAPPLHRRKLCGQSKRAACAQRRRDLRATETMDTQTAFFALKRTWTRRTQAQQSPLLRAPTCAAAARRKPKRRPTRVGPRPSSLPRPFDSATHRSAASAYTARAVSRRACCRVIVCCRIRRQALAIPRSPAPSANLLRAARGCGVADRGRRAVEGAATGHNFAGTARVRHGRGGV